MHSFQFARAIEAFNVILASDPSCAIAYWGIALSDWGNPFALVLSSRRNWNSGTQSHSASGAHCCED